MRKSISLYRLRIIHTTAYSVVLHHALHLVRGKYQLEAEVEFHYQLVFKLNLCANTGRVRVIECEYYHATTAPNGILPDLPSSYDPYSANKGHACQARRAACVAQKLYWHSRIALFLLSRHVREYDIILEVRAIGEPQEMPRIDGNSSPSSVPYHFS